jgi:hypothetical protein
MKKLILTLALGMACVSAFAQGTLIFGNANAQVNAPIWQDAITTGTKLAGTAWIAQLWYGPAGSVESALVANPTTATFSTTAAQAGYFFGGARTIDTIPAGSVAVLQVRVWNAAAGATWAAALANPTAYTGVSGLINATLTVPPATPVNMVGLGSFAVVQNVPEPSSFALAGLGAAALLIFRRRK